jgi:ferritin-like metal-binding protein YciE
MIQASTSHLKKLLSHLSKTNIMETQTAQTTDSKLKEFFIDQLEDLLWAEKKLVKTLPKLQEAATSAELKDAFGNHLTQTQNHVTRLEQVFGLIGEDVDTTKCAAMAGIVDEGEDIIDETEEGTAQRDVGLIFAGQKAEHYEIATYGGMVTLAKTLGYNDAADLLSQTLEEEKEADNLLTQIAENNINYQASTEPKEDKGFFS